jgi:DNA-binding MarR family transcriptional regulator
VKDAYLQIIALIERLHREFLEVVKAELDRRAIRDLNNVQAMILFNIGEEELSVGELTIRGCYLGSNVSYNLKKLTENGYIEQTRSPHDRRSVTVRLSEKGAVWRPFWRSSMAGRLAPSAIGSSPKRNLPRRTKC